MSGFSGYGSEAPTFTPQTGLSPGPLEGTRPGESTILVQSRIADTVDYSRIESGEMGKRFPEPVQHSYPDNMRRSMSSSPSPVS